MIRTVPLIFRSCRARTRLRPALASAAVLVLTAAGGASADGFTESESEGGDTTLTWQSDGAAQGGITFERDSYTGTAQFPGEGPVAYRGTLN
ncbi:hypothetical protein [Streptomyces sp. NPDC026589]|uniref:hypothetical protein n=1 Tax=Streptomyces sp. NPDC026589 TaxID=3155609 RepID=UPI0033F3ADFD